MSMRIARLTLAAGLFMATIALMLVPEPERMQVAPPPATDWREAFRAPLSTDERRILFIGNSFTSRNDLPSMVAGLLVNGGVAKTVHTRMVAGGGAQLHQHAADEILRRDIAELTWSTVVLQEFSTAALFETDKARSAAAVSDLARLAAQGGAEALLVVTWPRAEGHVLYGQTFEGFAAPETPADMARMVNAHFTGLAGQLNTRVAPVGDLWVVTSDVLPHIPLYAPDGYHAAPAGTYLAALVIARSLGLDPRKTEWAPEGVDPGFAGQLRLLVASSPG